MRRTNILFPDSLAHAVSSNLVLHPTEVVIRNQYWVFIQHLNQHIKRIKVPFSLKSDLRSNRTHQISSHHLLHIPNMLHFRLICFRLSTWEKASDRFAVHHIEIQTHYSTILFIPRSLCPSLHNLFHGIVRHKIIAINAHTQFGLDGGIGSIITRIKSAVRFVDIFYDELRGLDYEMTSIFLFKNSPHPIKRASFLNNRLSQAFHPFSCTICTTVINNQPIKIITRLATQRLVSTG